MNKLKDKVGKCENICGTHIALNSPAITEVLGYIGFDFIWIDTEHTSIDYQDLLDHLAAAKLTGTPAIVRLHINDYNHTKRVLEMGPDGVIFPMVNTAREAADAMKSCMYPPEGTRGFGPLRAVRYGNDDNDTYINNVNKELCRFIQIETETAVENLPEILENPYIDGYIFGPCDLSGSIGELNNVFGENNVALMRRSVELIRSAGKCIGVSTGSDDPKVVRFWHDLGINMISSGVDYDYIMKSARTNLNNIRKIQSGVLKLI